MSNIHSSLALIFELILEPPSHNLCRPKFLSKVLHVKLSEVHKIVLRILYSSNSRIGRSLNKATQFFIEASKGKTTFTIPGY